MPFDVDGSVPADFLLWQGMSGAGVRDRLHGRLLGVVVRVDEDRQQRRLYVASLPDPAVDTGFLAALTEVGAEPVLEAANAPVVRRLLAVWDQRGRPPAVRQVTQLDVFGARKARTDIDTHGDPYYPYVGRQLDRDIAEVLDRRAAGTERRVLLLVGEAMTGKSRTGAHALQVHPALSARPLLVPQQGADLREVVELAPAGGAVLWLDDLNTFAAGLSPGAVRYWQTRPGVVVVATLRADLLSSLQGNPDLRPAWTLIDDDSLVEQFPLPAEWSAGDQQALATAEDTVRNKVADGIPLGEVLAAAQELRDRLAVADPFQKAFAFTVIDWSRTGLTVRLPEVQAEELWIAYLSRKHAAVFQNRARDKRHQDFLQAVDWACEAIPGTAAMLVTRNDDGLLAEDYLVAQRTAAQQAIPHPLWQAALNQAEATEAPAMIHNLGYNAATAEVFDIARAAWEPLATGGTEEAPAASYNLGVILNRTGDLDGSRAAYQRAIDSHHPDAMPGASLNLGALLAEQQDPAGAKAAYQAAIDSHDPEAMPGASLDLGALLAEQQDPAGAKAAYQAAIDSGHAEYAPQAAFGLGLLLKEQQDPAGAKAAYQAAIDSGHAEYAPAAAFGLGVLLKEQQDLAGAKAAWQAAIDSGHAKFAPHAAVNLGVLLAEQQDLAGAKAAYQAAIDSGHAEYAPAAAFRLGVLLAEQQDLAGAKAAWQAAIDSGHAEYAPAAAFRLGVLLAEQQDLAGAKAAYQAAIDSGHAEYAPQAAFGLGLLLKEQQDPAGAKAAYQAAIDSGHAEYAPAAAFGLGVLLKEQQDPAGAKAAWQAAIDSGHAKFAPAAAFNLGRLLAEQQDLAGVKAAWQAAIDSGHAEYAPAAAFGLGVLLAEQQDLAGVKAAWQAAIDSGHAEFALQAAFGLGLLLKEQQDLAGAKAAYQAAIDSGHAEYAPAAAFGLGVLLRSSRIWRGPRRPGRPRSTAATPSTPPKPRSAWGCCSRSSRIWRGPRRPTRPPSTAATPSTPPKPRSAWGCCSRSSRIWRGPRRPTRPRSTAATPSTPRRPRSTWGCCSRSSRTRRGPRRPGRPRSTAATPSTPPKPRPTWGCCSRMLPGAQDPHLGGVHDADEEPGISGGVVGKVPVHMGEVPDSRQIFGGDCCLRAGAGRERRGRLARRGHGQQPAAGQHVDPRPPAGVLQPVAAAEDQRRGRQVLQRGTQLACAGPRQQLIMARCQDGADARDAQLHGGPAGRADPAAHRAGRDGQVTGDGPVPVPAGGGGQGLPDQAGGVGAARQQPGVQHHVGGAAAGAPRAVRADGQRRAAGVADGALAGVPPQPERLAAARAAQHPAGQRDPGRRRVEDLDHRPSRQDRPGRLVRTRGQLVLQRATLRRPAQPGTARSPGTGTWPTPGPAALAPDRRSLTPRIAHRRGAAANEPAWPGVAIGVPGAATASRHGNPERLSTLAEQRDPAGAKAAYQAAIDSGHAKYAPAAAANLGVLLAEQQDLAGARRPTRPPSTAATPSTPPKPRSAWGCCSRSSRIWRGPRRPGRPRSTAATPSTPPKPRSTWGCCSRSSRIWRGPRRPGRPRSTAATPSTPPKPRSTWGSCSRSSRIWRGPRRPTRPPSTAATPTTPPGLNCSSESSARTKTWMPAVFTGSTQPPQAMSMSW